MQPSNNLSRLINNFLDRTALTIAAALAFAFAAVTITVTTFAFGRWHRHYHRRRRDDELVRDAVERVRLRHCAVHPVRHRG